jgi:Ni/Fe-hydrogenase 1 B-type cytochrome subunit
MRIWKQHVKEVELDNVYVWQWPVRITHWVNAISIWVLSVTGIYIGFPFLISSGTASQNFWMGYAKAVHFYAAIFFTLSVLTRIAWMFMGNWYSRWHRFVPVSKSRIKAMGATFRYYMFGMRMPPGFVGHNPLAGLFYALVFFVFLLQIATGLALYADSAHVESPMRGFSFLIPLMGGLQTARWIHHVLMWGIWAFFVHHVYSAILMSQVEATGTVESIFSGHKFVPREDVIKPGYRLEHPEA